RDPARQQVRTIPVQKEAYEERDVVSDDERQAAQYGCRGKGRQSRVRVEHQRRTRRGEERPGVPVRTRVLQRRARPPCVPQERDVVTGPRPGQGGGEMRDERITP